MKPKQFKGWRIVGPRALLRADDRWSYFPQHYRSPITMFSVSDSDCLQAGERIPPRRMFARPVFVYRRLEK